ncbi:hypothetical protein NSZ01_08440 [Nocardioides szechwanensis]|uniref:Uncharacterized protein n=1 Tax=Nocardioides szechwanensis TaxID=1005944 RepID=A0A1G9V0G1_9ACTN|nr:hypothetical protein [Nocardioides szechwanensis]GEP33076.1 hypothetical protein NSZ01_08440 [Nocardioides szechwanensis]SDM65704.1 hypothetical protein SAMN05192576_0614 [Nocardioides szechwanensis]
MELRVGVSGHRHLADPGAVATAVDALLDELIEADTTLVAVSSLAEGADRVVAERVLARGGSLDVHLPLPPDDYAEDFPATTAEFDALLAAARSVTVVRQDGGSREAAYERAGLAVLDGCDVLLALWDGGPARGRGGTAELVAEARRQGRPVRVITVERAAP